MLAFSICSYAWLRVLLFGLSLRLREGLTVSVSGLAFCRASLARACPPGLSVFVSNPR